MTISANDFGVLGDNDFCVVANFIIVMANSLLQYGEFDMAKRANLGGFHCILSIIEVKREVRLRYIRA